MDNKLNSGQVRRASLECLMEEWIKKMWYIYTMECYSAIIKKEITPFAVT